MQALRYETQVTDEHVIHLNTPDLPCGTVVELIALIKEPSPKLPMLAERIDWTTKIGKYPRFDSLEQVNQYVQSLRE